MTILIIEDEQPAGERLAAMVREFDPSAAILGTLRSIVESVAWLSSHPAPDLILADIQLTDGLSLEIFRRVPVTSPLIFTTAYDEHVLSAFEFTSIDYLLKPVDKEKLFRALRKYLVLKTHFHGDVLALIGRMGNNGVARDRLVVKKGMDFVSIRMDQVAYFFTEHKLTFLVDTDGRRYIVDRPLSDLESELDPRRFFRLNRKYLAHVAAIVRFRSHEKGKVLVELKPAVSGEVVVSQEQAAAFKVWIGR